MPRVSVVITSYNYGRYIGDAIRSVITQSYRDLDVLVCDNGSTDDTAAVVASFGYDARVRFERNPTNLGIVGNHNRGIERTSGEFVLFLSADDFLLPGHIAQTLAYYDAHPGVALVSTSYYTAAEDGRITAAFRHVGHISAPYAGGRNEFADLLTYDNYFDLATTLVRRSLFDDLGAFDPALNIGFDYEFFTRLAAARRPLAFALTPRVAKRVHGPQASGSSYETSGNQFREQLHILEKHLDARTAALVRGRESGILALLQAKANNASALQTASVAELAALQARADAVVGRLAEMARQPFTAELPAFSVIVTCNAADLDGMRATLGSLVAQRFNSWEALIVGSGVVDLTSFVDSLAGWDRLRYLAVAGPATPASLRNIGLKVARGSRIAYLDHGACYAPDYLARISEALDGGARAVRGAARRGAPGPNPATETSQLYVADDVPLSAIAHERSLLSAVRGFDERFSAVEGWEFRLRLESAASVAYVPDAHLEVTASDAQRRPGLAAEVSAIYAAYPNAALDGARRQYLAQAALAERPDPIPQFV
jgi:glycosyltransferase involved in cell wall biosynthesis